MDIKKLQEFNKRWSIQNSLSYEEEFNRFKTRVFNIFEEIDRYVTQEGIAQFCQILAIPEKWRQTSHGKLSINIFNALKAETEEKQFYRILQVIASLPTQALVTKNGFFRRLGDAIDLSNINLAMTIKEDGEIIFHPRGEKLLDKKLIDEVMSFLNAESQKHFIDALNFYQKSTAQDAIKSSEGIRRCIEELLRFKLKNSKGLDANIKDIQAQLKKDARDPVIRSIIFQVFNYLDGYFNENSKHKDGDINEAENEFLIYQAGTLMRYIHKTIKVA